MHEDSQILLRHVLEAPLPSSTSGTIGAGAADIENFHKMKSAYDACMDEVTIQSQQSGPLIAILEKIEGLFPAKKPYDAEEFSSPFVNQVQKISRRSGEEPLSAVMAYIMSIGVGALISTGVSVSIPIGQDFQGVSALSVAYLKFLCLILLRKNTAFATFSHV